MALIVVVSYHCCERLMLCSLCVNHAPPCPLALAPVLWCCWRVCSFCGDGADVTVVVAIAEALKYNNTLQKFTSVYHRFGCADGVKAPCSKSRGNRDDVKGGRGCLLVTLGCAFDWCAVLVCSAPTPYPTRPPCACDFTYVCSELSFVRFVAVVCTLALPSCDAAVNGCWLYSHHVTRPHFPLRCCGSVVPAAS